MGEIKEMESSALSHDQTLEKDKLNDLQSPVSVVKPTIPESGFTVEDDTDKSLPKLESPTTQNRGHNHTENPFGTSHQVESTTSPGFQLALPGPIDPSSSNAPSSEVDEEEDDDFFSMSNLSHQSLPQQPPLVNSNGPQGVFQPDADPLNLPAPKFTLQRVLSPSPDLKQHKEDMDSTTPLDFSKKTSGKVGSLAAQFEPFKVETNNTSPKFQQSSPTTPKISKNIETFETKDFIPDAFQDHVVGSTVSTPIVDHHDRSHHSDVDSDSSPKYTAHSFQNDMDLSSPSTNTSTMPEKTSPVLSEHTSISQLHDKDLDKPLNSPVVSGNSQGHNLYNSKDAQVSQVITDDEESEEDDDDDDDDEEEDEEEDDDDDDEEEEEEDEEEEEEDADDEVEEDNEPQHLEKSHITKKINTLSHVSNTHDNIHDNITHVHHATNNLSLNTHQPDPEDDESPTVVLTLNDGDDLQSSPAYDNSEVLPEIQAPAPLHPQNPFNSIKQGTPATRALDDILNGSVNVDNDQEESDPDLELDTKDKDFDNADIAVNGVPHAYDEYDVDDESDINEKPHIDDESNINEKPHIDEESDVDDEYEIDETPHAYDEYDVDEKSHVDVESDLNKQPHVVESDIDEKPHIYDEYDESDAEDRPHIDGKHELIDKIDSTIKPNINEPEFDMEPETEPTHEATRSIDLGKTDELDTVNASATAKDVNRFDTSIEQHSPKDEPLTDTDNQTTIRDIKNFPAQHIARDSIDQDQGLKDTHSTQKSVESEFDFNDSAPASKYVDGVVKNATDNSFNFVNPEPQSLDEPAGIQEKSLESVIDSPTNNHSIADRAVDPPVSDRIPHSFDFAQPEAFKEVEISQSPPPIPVEKLSPKTLKRHISASSLPRNITNTEPVPAVPDIPYDDFDEYNPEETAAQSFKQQASTEKNIGRLSEAFKFPGSPRTPSSSTFPNVTRAARSESITGGINPNFSSPNGYNSMQSPTASQSYMTTFEAPTNIPEVNGVPVEREFDDSNSEFIPIDTSAPLSTRKSVSGLRSAPSSHSVTLEPIEADNTVLDETNQDNIIFAVCVVGFHHIRGPEVEYWIGGDNKDQAKLWPNLPFQSLPDGSHSHEENFCYFSLLYNTKNKTAPIAVPTRDKAGNIIENVPDMTNVTTLFGISCNRQIKSTDLKERPADVTRSIVQKSVVVIARKPIFGAIREKLAVITRAYFQQGDFEDRSLVHSLYDNLAQMFANKVDESDMYVRMSVRELIYRLRSKVLLLLKALLLEKKVFFFGNNTEALCASQFALVSLIPNLINHLEDCGSPLLNSYEAKMKKPNSLKSSDRNSLLNYMGLPLHIFAEGGLFTAYVPLQQMNELKAPETKYFLVGSTNSMLLAPQNRVADIIVYIDSDNVEVINTSLNSALALSSYDKKWMDMVVKAVVDTWDPEDPGRPKGLGFHGSEDFVRQQFEDYLKGLLSVVKYDKFLARANHLKQPMITARDMGANHIKYFNTNWVKEWRTTNNFRIFSKFTDDELFDIVEPKHVAFTMAAPDAKPASAPQNVANGSIGSEIGNEAPAENVAAKVTKVWGSLWWGQPQPQNQGQDGGSSPRNASVSGPTDPNESAEDLSKASLAPRSLDSNGGKHQTKPSDDFQDTSLYEQEPIPSGNGTQGGSFGAGGSNASNSSTGLFIGKRTRSTTTSTTASNNTVNGTGGAGGAHQDSSNSTPLTSTQSSISNNNDGSSHKSTVSTASSFFNGWSLWGNNKNNGEEKSPSGSTKSP